MTFSQPVRNCETFEEKYPLSRPKKSIIKQAMAAIFDCCFLVLPYIHHSNYNRKYSVQFLSSRSIMA